MCIRGASPSNLGCCISEAAGRSGELVVCGKQTNAIRRFIPAILSCIGAGILEFGNVHEPPQFRDTLLFLPPLAYSIAFWRCEKIACKLGPRHQPEVMTFYIMLCSFILSAAYALHCGRYRWTARHGVVCVMSVSPRTWRLFLIYEGCLATAFVSAVEQHVLRLLSAAEVTVIYSLEPIFATLTSILIGEDTVQPSLFIAGAFIVLACLLDGLWT